ncbi:MAG: hypothetical protein RIK87_05815 [Fuerstiella sp.]
MTVLYFLTSAACLIAYRRLRQFSRTTQLAPQQSTEARFWLVVTVLLGCLGVNKQADLQSLFTLLGRDLLRQADLYDHRRSFQLAFIAAVTFTAAGSIVTGIWLARRWSWPCRLATFGLVLQAAFVVVRAASFHHVDRLLGWQPGNVKFNLILESSGLLIILGSAAARCSAETTVTDTA